LKARGLNSAVRYLDRSFTAVFHLPTRRMSGPYFNPLKRRGDSVTTCFNVYRKLCYYRIYEDPCVSYYLPGIIGHNVTKQHHRSTKLYALYINKLRTLLSIRHALVLKKEAAITSCCMHSSSPDINFTHTFLDVSYHHKLIKVIKQALHALAKVRFLQYYDKCFKQSS